MKPTFLDDGLPQSLAAADRDEPPASRRWPLVGALEHLRPFVAAFAGLNGRAAELYIDAPDLWLSTDEMERLLPGLFAVLRHAVLAGVEDPLTRLRAGKGLAGRLELEVEAGAFAISITVTTDGPAASQGLSALAARVSVLGPALAAAPGGGLRLAMPLGHVGETVAGTQRP